MKFSLYCTVVSFQNYISFPLHFNITAHCVHGISDFQSYRIHLLELTNRIHVVRVHFIVDEQISINTPPPPLRYNRYFGKKEKLYTGSEIKIAVEMSLSLSEKKARDWRGVNGET